MPTHALRADERLDASVALDAARAAFERAQMLEAWRLVDTLDRPERWTRPEDRVFAARLIEHLGAPRRGRHLLLSTWRRHRRNDSATLYRAYHLAAHRGPLAALRFIEAFGEIDQPPHLEERQDLCLIAAGALADLRDFTSAERSIARAQGDRWHSPWHFVVESRVLAAQDRHPEALERARQALVEQPDYRPALHQVALALGELGRHDEALELLAGAAQRVTCAALSEHHAALARELGHFDVARASLLRGLAASPLLELDRARQLANKLCELAYRVGDHAELARLAPASGQPVWLDLAGKPSAARAGARVQLAVPLVRQHHKTCAPATLAAICKYFEVEAEHVDIAEAICYDGTPARSERRWALGEGFAVREFTVDWDSACALIDRGLPFTLTLVAIDNAHMVAVTGYDALRRTLIIRDPGLAWVYEADADALLAAQAAYGPRGMVFAPRGQEARLQGIALPDADRYDRSHALDEALRIHDRARALVELAALSAEAPPRHYLVYMARASLATYDDDALATLEAINEWRKAYPQERKLLLACAYRLSGLERLGEARALVEASLASPPVDPPLRFFLAEQLSVDDRTIDEALWQLHLAHLGGPRDGRGLMLEAVLASQRGAVREGLKLLRLAAGMAETDEARAWALWQTESDVLGAEAALQALRERALRLGARAAAPTLTLMRALVQLDRNHEAAAVLEEGLRLLRDDSELLLAAVNLSARLQRFDRARELLEQVRPRCHRARWWRSAATVDREEGRLSAALADWHEVLALEPLALDAHTELTDIQRQQQGPAAAVTALRASYARFPHHHGLARLFIGTLGDVAPLEAIEELERFLQRMPEDPWALRELALRVAEQGRHEQARALIGAAARIEPDDVRTRMCAGTVERLAGDAAAARASFGEALRRAPGAAAGLSALVDLCASVEGDRRWLLEHVRAVAGGGRGVGSLLLAVCQSAVADWFASELAELVAAARKAAPDDGSLALASVELHVRTNRYDEAERELDRLIRLQPNRTPARVVLARLHSRRGRPEAEREALRAAVAMDPSAAVAARRLAELHAAAGEYAEAAALLERLERRDPGDLRTLIARVDLSLMQGRPEGALERLCAFLTTWPRDAAAWDYAARCAFDDKPAGAAQRIETLARAQVEAGTAIPAAGLALARLLRGSERLSERLAVMDRVLAADPLNVDATDLKCQLLAEGGRWDDARAACCPPIFGDHLPTPLRGRAAWLQWMRDDHDGAIAAMEAIVVREPGYRWGFALLMRWCASKGDLAPVERLAERVAAARADDVDLRLELAQLAPKRIPWARRWVEAALAIAPDHGDAKLLLFDVLMTECKLDEADAILERCDANNPYVAARQVRLATTRQRGDVALAQFRIVCSRAGDGDSWPVSAANEWLQSSLRGRHAQEVMDDVVRTATPNATLLYLWMQGLLWRMGVTSALWRLRKLASRPDIHRAATAQLLRQVKRGSFLAWCFVWWRGRALRRWDETWAAVGTFLVTRRAYRRVVRYMADWRQRAKLMPQMLIPLVSSLRALGRGAAAAEVSRAALALPDDGEYLVHRLWLAFDEAKAEGSAAPRALAPDVQHLEKASPFRGLRGLVDILMELRDGPGEREERVRACRRRLEQYRPLSLPPSVRRARRECARILRDARPGIGSWLWWLRDR